jgi:hypothetical protein
MASAPPVLLPNKEVASAASAIPFDNICTSVPQGGANTLEQPEASSAQASVPVSPAQCPNENTLEQPEVSSPQAFVSASPAQCPNVLVRAGMPQDGYKTKSGRSVRARKIFDPSA